MPTFLAGKQSPVFVKHSCILKVIRLTGHLNRRRYWHVAHATLGPELLYGLSGAPQHDFPGHPECAARVPAIIDVLDVFELSDSARPKQVVQLSSARDATLEEIIAIHDQRYVTAVQRLSEKGGRGGATSMDASSLYITSSTYQDSLRAAGTVLSLVDEVMAAAPMSHPKQEQQQAPTAFAICRPPGHHSLPKEGMGFCIFSTAAIAARYAQQQHGVGKVAIFDFDVHHGNGTNDTFYEDPSVLFISTHQTGLWPGTGKLGEVGKGEGEGTSINVPLPGDAGHEAMLAAMEEVVEPALRRFHPDLLLISAGYDAHWRDPLGGMQLRTSTYHALAARLRGLALELCQGRLVLLLEGGYDLKALGESVANTFLGVLGEGARDRFNPDLLRDEPLDKVQGVLREARRLHGL